GTSDESLPATYSTHLTGYAHVSRVAGCDVPAIDAQTFREVLPVRLTALGEHPPGRFHDDRGGHVGAPVEGVREGDPRSHCDVVHVCPSPWCAGGQAMCRCDPVTHCRADAT